ncbi:hypothetical protein BH09CHL1_BH09CHL1_20800 [soil metagenome]
MTGTVGVFCARTRVEEKQLIAAFAGLGREALPVSPVAAPAPLGPTPVQPLAETSVSGAAAEMLIDRLQDRELAAMVLRSKRAAGASIFGAGIAATEDRHAVALTLARAGIARPTSYAVFDELTALDAIATAGYPSTFLALTPKTADLTMFDRDTAEAVMEHREMLRDKHDAMGLVQVGIKGVSATVIVAGGNVVGVDGDQSIANGAAFDLAIATANALQADIIGVVICATSSGYVVWDIDPVPDFRNAVATGGTDVATAIILSITASAGTVPLPSMLITAWEANHNVLACG